MPCFRPTKGYQNLKGEFKKARTAQHFIPIEIPCSICHGCRQEKRDEWATRCLHEAKYHESNCFITLTYDDDNLPYGGSLVRWHFDKFIKDLRNYLAKQNVRIRYFGCGEYGSKTKRPHYHILIFGYFPKDAISTPASTAQKLFRSTALESLWPRGFVSVGLVEYGSAMYCAKYCMDRDPKSIAEKKGTYDRTSVLTMDLYTVDPEFTAMSRRPGIGKKWIEDNWKDVFPRDEIIVLTPKGFKKVKPPTYYMDWLQENYPAIWLEVKRQRRIKSDEQDPNETRETRLAQRELSKRRNASIISKRTL